MGDTRVDWATGMGAIRDSFADHGVFPEFRAKELTMTHTPIPWYVAGKAILGPPSEATLNNPSLNNWELVGSARRHEDRQLIVLAVNNHQTLLEALEDLTPLNWSLNDPMRRKYAVARAAIARVTEEK